MCSLRFEALVRVLCWIQVAFLTNFVEKDNAFRVKKKFCQCYKWKESLVGLQQETSVPAKQCSVGHGIVQVFEIFAITVDLGMVVVGVETLQTKFCGKMKNAALFRLAFYPNSAIHHFNQLR